MEVLVFRLVLLVASICLGLSAPTTGGTTQPYTSQLDKLEGMLGHIQNTMVVIGSSVQQVKDNIHQNALKEDIKVIKADQQAIRADVDRMKTDIQHVKDDTDRMKRTQQDLMQEMDRFRTDKQSHWAEMDRMKKDQQDLKTYLIQQNKAMEEKIEMALTRVTKGTQQPIQILANFDLLEMFQRKDFRPIFTKTPKVHRDCRDAYDNGWETPGLYRVKPEGGNESDIYCQRVKKAGRWTISSPVCRDFFLVPKDCLEVYEQGNTQSGVCSIYPDDQTMIKAFCEQELDGGGWTVFQRRFDGSVDFYLPWSEYKSGFGETEGEYWLGNDAIHNLTSNKNSQLKVELTKTPGDVKYADYSSFWLEDEAHNYTLHVSGYSGGSPPGDSLSHHNGMMFTTKDRDNDKYKVNCATQYKGGWWYNACHRVNLNGMFGSTTYGQGLNWYDWVGYTTTMARTRMMARRNT